MFWLEVILLVLAPDGALEETTARHAAPFSSIEACAAELARVPVGAFTAHDGGVVVLFAAQCVPDGGARDNGPPLM